MLIIRPLAAGLLEAWKTLNRRRTDYANGFAYRFAPRLSRKRSKSMICRYRITRRRSSKRAAHIRGVRGSAPAVGGLIR